MAKISDDRSRYTFSRFAQYWSVADAMTNGWQTPIIFDDWERLISGHF